MANGRNSGRKGDSGRDGGGFVALPWTVLDCPAYARLSHPARSLLMEIARQIRSDNNGRLLASRAYLLKRGWKSASVIDQAKHDLIDAGFIFETVKGHRPNRASWYAVTWRVLDKHQGYDAGAIECFVRGAYQKNASLNPCGGTVRPFIAPSNGTERPRPVPSHRPIRHVLPLSSVPSHGHHIEIPSGAGNGARGLRSAVQTTPQQLPEVRYFLTDIDGFRQTWLTR